MVNQNQFSSVTFSITAQEEKKDWGKFVISPLPAGFGSTVGNSLRRTLLGSLPGAAITQVKIKGASHLFTSLKGVKEDLVDFVLNLKKINFDYSGEKAITLKLAKSGVGVIKASDIVLQPKVKIANPELVLATITDKKVTFKADLTVACGVGFEMAEEHKSATLGVIGIDAVFSPVVGVNYQVEPARRGKRIDLDKLVIEIQTNGSIKPSKALKQAALILSDVFGQIVNPKEIAIESIEEFDAGEQSLLIEEVDQIPLRLSNALKKAGYRTVQDLVDAGSQKVIKAKNVGENSIELLKKALKKKNVNFI